MPNSDNQSLASRVAVVTGASRGIGKGIALELGAAGATVYLTGRTSTEGRLPGSVSATAEEIADLGGHGIGVVCDHGDDEAVGNLFALVAEQSGRLDILVNNVYNSPAAARWLGKPFWEVPAKAWDETFVIGVRSHYVAAGMAAPMLLASGGGLIANVSSPGSVRYMHNTVYGVGKAAVDRMTKDMAHDLDGRAVTVVSIWPGIVNTELLQMIPAGADGRRVLTLPGEGEFDLSAAESPRFAGRAVVALAGDSKRDRWSGQAVYVADLADHYGFTDVDGRVPRPPEGP
ncbi:MAG TPA: SDR family NAD(P)-dependent oxidoreductase [Acidimicrobiales bacterium]|nr:SDR family NAD(P)-dependent oxidoreductase [Acidimicrobiales bacterium]